MILNVTEIQQADFRGLLLAQQNSVVQIGKVRLPGQFCREAVVSPGASGQDQVGHSSTDCLVSGYRSRRAREVVSDGRAEGSGCSDSLSKGSAFRPRPELTI